MTVSSEQQALSSINSRAKRMSRIGLLIGLLYPIFLPAASEAQQPKTPRIGYVSNNTASSPGPLVEAFRQGLRELGYTDQRNIVVEYRYAEGNQERIATLVNELVHSSVDLLVIPSGIGAQAAKKRRKQFLSS